MGYTVQQSRIDDVNESILIVVRNELCRNFSESRFNGFVIFFQMLVRCVNVDSNAEWKLLVIRKLYLKLENIWVNQNIPWFSFQTIWWNMKP